MNIGVLGDLHLTSRGPRRRLDNYFETQLRKLNECFDIFKANDCYHIIQVGDFFESPDISNYVISTLIELLLQRSIIIHCIFGQHDISGHSKSTLKRSPLRVLEAAGVVDIIQNNPTTEYNNIWAARGTEKRYLTIYGTSFGEDIPVVVEKDTFNILVIHRMIGDKLLYPGQELTNPAKFLKDNPEYNLILCGDYHYRFVDKYNDRIIVNPGCLMRKTIGKRDLSHKPACVVIDIIKETINIHELTIHSNEEVFDMCVVEKKDNKNLEIFIENLKNNSDNNTDWKRNLIKVLKQTKSSDFVKDLIDKALLKVKGEVL